MSNSNIIRKQIIELRFTGDEDPFVSQQSTNEWCLQQLLPSIEQRLERFAATEEVIRIYEITVEWKMEGTAFDESLAEKIAAEIERMVESKISLADKPDQRNDGIVKLNREAAYIECLIFFLEYGYLPWYAKIFSVESLKEVLRHVSAATPESRQVEHLKEVLQQPQALQRLHTAGKEFISVILAIVVPGEKNVIQRHSEQVIKLSLIIRSDQLRKKFIQNVQHFFVAEILRHKTSYNNVVVLQNAVILLLLQNNITIVELEDYIKHESLFSKAEHTYIFSRENIEWLSQQLLKKNCNDNIDPGTDKTDDNIITQKSKSEPSTPGKKSKTQKKEADNLLQGNEEVIKQQKIIQQKQAIQKEEGIYINNAGLVIVALFLPRLFENMGVAENGKLNSVSLAAAILHYIATGSDEYAEFELVLPKILCGLQPEDNIDIVSPLPQTFITEANEMLQAVITHWDILKDTSIDGLRQSFLKREGKLQFIKNEWLLQVEQKSYDMLLQQLPWNISMLKLSWMPHMLKTEWI